MRRGCKFSSLALLIGILVSANCFAGFDPSRDTFAFSNETVFAYEFDEQGGMHVGRKEKPPAYAHRCFVMTRAALQFYQFARFEPKQPRASHAAYANIIRQICRIPVWSAGPREKIVVPGFRDLRDFSKTEPTVLQENLGAWLPTYLRVGNWRMGMGHLRAGQAAAAEWLARSMDEGRPRAVYLARFPHMNHCVIVYAAERRPGGDIRFSVYDPNYAGETTWLKYVGVERSFDFAPRWYFHGGRVNVMRIYISPLH